MSRAIDARQDKRGSTVVREIPLVRDNKLRTVVLNAIDGTIIPHGPACQGLRHSFGSTVSPNSRIDPSASASAMSLKLTCNEAISKSPI